MKVVMLSLLLGGVACGSRGKAQPAEVEISWPDASMSTPASPADTPPTDAGTSQPPAVHAADAGQTAEMPQ